MEKKLQQDYLIQCDFKLDFYKMNVLSSGEKIVQEGEFLGREVRALVDFEMEGSRV